MNRIETPDGVLKYKNPGIIKTMQIMRDARKHFAKDDPIEAKLSVIGHLEELIVYDEMKTIKTWSQLDEAGELTVFVSEMADDILGKCIKALEKKNLSPMP